MLLYLLAGTAIAEANTPARDYKTVNFDNGITSRILEIGTTSVTFSVECSFGVDVPAKLDLIGKLNMDWETWNFWGEMNVIPKDGCATVEYRYSRFSDSEPEATMFSQKAFFSLQRSVEPEDWERVWGLEGYGQKGTVEPPINAPFTEAKEDRVTASPPNNEDNLRMRNEELSTGDDEELEAEKQEKTNRLWLYLAILPFILTILYLIRKRFSCNHS